MSDKSTHSKILILDFGSQYTQVIARRIRECQVYSEIVRFDTPAAEIAALKPKGVILSGGPASVYDKGAPQIDPNIFSLGVPVLGICYGLMLMANHLGGRVVFSGRREYGAGVLHVKNGSELLGGLGEQLDVWNSHGDEVTALPKGFRVTGTFQMGSNSDVRHGDGAVWKDSKRFAFCGTASTANLDEVEISPVDLR
jgi:GMP synthase (glutamine-hydrolysing)